MNSHELVELVDREAKKYWQARTPLPEMVDAIKRNIPHANTLEMAEIKDLILSAVPSFNAISAKNLAEKEIEVPSFLIDGWIPVGLSMLAGPPKIGKSFMALDFALASSLSGYALGGIPVKSPGKNTLYLALEDPPVRLQQRLLMYCKDGVFPENLYLMPMGSLTVTLDDAGLSWLGAYVRRLKIKFVIIDTWQKIRPPTPDKGTLYEVEYEHLATLQRFAHENKISVLVVHHTRKSPDPFNPMNTISGSTGVQAALDGCIVILRGEHGV